MNNLTKKEAMFKWLESNKGKTEFDWLLEERCTNDIQREALKELLECCDTCDVKYEISYEVNLEKEYEDLKSELLHIVPDINRDEDLQGYRTAIFEEYGIEYSDSYILDLYIPHIGWYINIGSEIEDIATDFWTRETVTFLPYSRQFGLTFNQFLNSRYHFPISNRYRNVVDGCYNDFLPWNRDVFTKLKKTDLARYGFKLVPISHFWVTLFKDHFNEMMNFRKERYLNSNPDVKEKRINMLHTLVIGMQSSLGIKKSMSQSQICKLLDTIDNELSIFYPEYGDIHNMSRWMYVE